MLSPHLFIFVAKAESARSDQPRRCPCVRRNTTAGSTAPSANVYIINNTRVNHSDKNQARSCTRFACLFPATMALRTFRCLLRSSSKVSSLDEVRANPREVGNAIQAMNKQAKRVQDRTWFLSDCLNAMSLNCLETQRAFDVAISIPLAANIPQPTSQALREVPNSADSTSIASSAHDPAAYSPADPSRGFYSDGFYFVNRVCANPHSLSPRRPFPRFLFLQTVLL